MTMAFCTACGTQVADGTAFCPKCGKPISAAPPAGHPAPPPPAQHHQGAVGGTGMEQNIASFLCYLVGWVTGIIFLIVDKRPTVRFHAAQSIVVFGAISILFFIIREVFYTSIFWAGVGMGWSLGYAIYLIVELGAAVLWILLMVKAYQGQMFRVPVAANIADSLVGKV
jgi:uncharacterized membrane protein